MLRVARASAVRARTQAFNNLFGTMISAPSPECKEPSTSPHVREQVSQTRARNRAPADSSTIQDRVSPG